MADSDIVQLIELSFLSLSMFFGVLIAVNTAILFTLLGGRRG